MAIGALEAGMEGRREGGRDCRREGGGEEQKLSTRCSTFLTYKSWDPLLFLPPSLPPSLFLGDQHFVDGVAAVLNQRHIIYVGDGAVTTTNKEGEEEGTAYRIGDVFAQYTCGYEGREEGREGGRDLLSFLHQVPFTARNLPN